MSAELQRAVEELRSALSSRSEWAPAELAAPGVRSPDPGPEPVCIGLLARPARCQLRHAVTAADECSLVATIGQERRSRPALAAGTYDLCIDTTSRGTYER